MRGWVSAVVLLGLGVGLGWLGVAELQGAFAAAGEPETAALSVLGAMIAIVPAAVFAGLGAVTLRRAARLEREAVDALAALQERIEPVQAVVIPFPGGRFARRAAD